MFTWNCNHFTNELLKELVGKELPGYMFRLTNMFRYLCCCLPQSLVNGQWALRYLLGSSATAEAEQAAIDDTNNEAAEQTKRSPKPSSV